MRTTRSLSASSTALGVLLLATASAGRSASADTAAGPERGVPAHYIVFELDADGVPHPMSHRIVRLGGSLESGTDAALERRLDSVPRDAESVLVKLLTPDGRVAFQDVVEVPRWVNVESGLHGDAGSHADELRPAQRAFVVRVPVSGAVRLQLSSARGPAGGAPVEFDLGSMGMKERLPLADLVRWPGQEAPPPNSGNRVDLLVMGDGYTAAEEAKFHSDSAAVLGSFFNIPPYREYQNFVNAGTLFTPSAQSGADHPPYSSGCTAALLPDCCGDAAMQTDPRRGTLVDTAFDATYCSYNVHRLLAINTAKVLAAAAAYPDWDKILVIVNDSTYGGAGGSVLTTSTHASALSIAQHEYGHTFTKLTDEYSSPYPGFPACSDLSGTAPCEPNATDQTTRGLIKWNPWILSSTPIPTTGTDNSVVGLFQGARYLSAGFYRPQFNCLMRTLGAPFCRICAQAYVLKLYRGGWGNPASGIESIEPGSENPAPGTVPLGLPASLPLSVGLVQPSGGTLSAAWTVNGSTAASGGAFTFRAATPGTYVVQLRTHDATPLVNAAMAGGALDRVRTWTVQATGQGSASPSANFAVSPAAPAAGQSAQFTDTSGGAPTSWSWSFGDGGTSTARNPTHVYQTPGPYSVGLTVSDGSSWSTTSKNVTVGPPGSGGAESVLTVPIVLTSSGANSAFFTSELALTNRGSSDASISYAYTAAFGGSSGSATDSLQAGRQKVLSDVIAVLRGLGIPLGDSGNRGGTLRITFNGLSSGDAGAATIRTTTSVAGGRAGLAYAGLASPRLLSAPVYLCGLRQNATDRSNVAVINAGGPSDGNITLRLTVVSGDPSNPKSQALPDITLTPGGWSQISGILASNGLGLSNGTVRVERIAGSAPFVTYGVINDQANSDGSFVEPVLASPASAVTGLTLPVIVETSAFSSELVLSNLTSSPRTVRFTYVSSALPGGSVNFDIALAAHEQQILPAFVQVLRSRGVIPGAPGPTFTGALFATDVSGDLRGISMGARTSSPGGGGRFGLYYPAVPAGSEATTSAWLYGLQQNAENRTNLALVNVGSPGSSTDVFRIDLYDGATGQKAATVDNVSVPARGFVQINAILATYAAGVTSGYALVTRVSGSNPFIAYAVVNDGGQSGQRTGDGAFVSAVVPAGP